MHRPGSSVCSSYTDPVTVTGMTTFRPLSQPSTLVLPYMAWNVLLSLRPPQALGELGGWWASCPAPRSHRIRGSPPPPLCSLYTRVLEAPVAGEAQSGCSWLCSARRCPVGQSQPAAACLLPHNTPCALQWAVTNEQPQGALLRWPCQLFDFTGA